MRYTHLLFDLDGTLIDSKRGIFNAVRYTLDKLEIPVSSRPSDFNPFIGPPLRDSFREVFNFSPDKAELATHIYREYYGEQGLFEFDIYEGILETIPRLKEAGFELCLVTSKAQTYARRIIESTPIYRHFTSITGCEIDGTRSLKNELITYALQNINIPASKRIIMIGDRYHDIRGAKLVNISSAAVLYGYGSEQELKEESPDIFIKHPYDLIDIGK
ncbi:MAG TPA: HAD hydrolase-like protein [Lentimicrobium sp.]|nr:HAD hydrolase-like protein [Lentimicrobium sp.]